MSSLSFRKVLSYSKQLTLEPILFLSFIGMSISQVTQSVGFYQSICKQIYISRPEIDCSHLANTTVDGVPAENEVQKRVAMWNMAIGVSYLAPALIADVFMGAYGDRHGRKVNMLLGTMGNMLSLFPMIVLFTFPLIFPMYILIIFNVIMGFTGYVSITLISASAYLTDTMADPESLTIRMATLTVVVSLATVLGPLISGATAKALTHPQSMLLAASFLAAAFFVCMAFIRQVPPAIMRRLTREKYENAKRAETLEIHELKALPAKVDVPDEAEVKESLCILTLNLLKETWRTYTKPRQGHVRLYLLLAGVVYFLYMVSEGLRATVIALYLQKQPLSWSQDTIGYYRSAQNAMSMVGTTVGALVFKKLLRFADTFIILIACMSHIGEILLMAFATSSWIVYTSSAVSCMSTLALPCIQAFLAKQVANDEVGKAFIAFGISANIAFLLSNAVYNPMYAATITFFPGFVFLFTAFLLITAFMALLWLHYDVSFKKQSKDLGWKKRIIKSFFSPEQPPVSTDTKTVPIEKAQTDNKA